MNYYVYYHDDYDENGGMGFYEAEDELDALNFIELRMKQNYNNGNIPKLEDYILIQGNRLNIEKVEMITKIRIK